MYHIVLYNYITAIRKRGVIVVGIVFPLLYKRFVYNLVRSKRSDDTGLYANVIYSRRSVTKGDSWSEYPPGGSTLLLHDNVSIIETRL